MIRAIAGTKIGAAHERLLRLARQASALPPADRALVQEVLETCSAAFEEVQMMAEELRVQDEEMRSTRADLEAERRRYLDVFEGAPYAYLVTNVGGLIQDANAAAMEMLGTPKRDLVGTPLVFYVDPGDRALLHARLNQLAGHGRAKPGEIEWEMRLLPRQQPSFPAAWSVALVSGAGDNPTSFRWLVRDLRAGKRTEERGRLLPPARCDLAEQLAQEQAILKTIAEHAHAALAYFDNRCDLLHLNAACARLLDVGGEELATRNPLDLLPGGGRAICQQVIASGRPITCDGESIILPDQYWDQAQYWDWALVPVVDGNGQGQGAVLSLVDVTERQQAEARLKGSLEELRRQNELLQQSARIVSHDLTAPLQSVLGYLELLEEEGRSGGTQTSRLFVESALRNAHRMQLMIRGLLEGAWASEQSPPLQPVDLARVLAWVLESLQVEIEQSGATVTHDPLPTVRGDELLLGHVFQNLIANAIKFRENAPPQIHVSARAAYQPLGDNGAGEQWILSVQDNGIGFDLEEADRVFEPFERLHSAREFPGTGLGLAICNRIVERHGGRIWCEAQPGDGATFYVSLVA
ncbi:MAG: sensor histidine kinase [Anaerolineae bacterium]